MVEYIKINRVIEDQVNKLLKKISIDYDLNFNELKEKYNKPIIEKVKRKRGHNGYTVFLGDECIDKKVRKSNPESVFKEKGRIWKEMSEDEKDVYRKLADRINKTKDDA